MTFLIRCVTCYCEILKTRTTTGKAAYFLFSEVMMVRVGIEEIKPGMILENPVKNNQGVLLLEAVVKISKKKYSYF